METLLDHYPRESAVRKAYEFAEEAHREAKRESGEPYFTHCVKTAETVRDWGLDDASIAAALLHDVVEDTAFTVKDIEKRFGGEIAFLVNGLTKLEEIKYPKRDADAENLRKLIIFFAKDLRVLLIKLADRLHNMSTLAALPPERRERLAWETIEIYAPLAYRLGMQKLSGELEDLAFPHAYPEEYRWLMDMMKETYAERLAYALKVKPALEKALAEHHIRPVSVDARAKRYYSLYKKLQRCDMDLEKIYDLVALRVVVETIEDCYNALGVVHQLWPPLPGRIKDYIARPKPNGYASLHTAVFCLENRITEFQIRTKEMHEEAELGIAAHWAYQQVKKDISKKKEGWMGVRSRHELLWVEQLRNWQKQFQGREGFLESLKVDFFKDRIFVLTPQNEVIDLPYGATPVDFAYRIHSELGNTCVGAKVNGKLIPLSHELQSGDVVEIVTQRGKKPSEDWLAFVKTELAKRHIKSATRPVGIAAAERKGEGPMFEFKVVNEDRPGYLKEVTGAFGELKVNITYLQSQTDPRRKFSLVTARSPLIQKTKLEKLLVKLKKIPGTREVSYRVNR
ncbi:MAG: RelA/SpoT family protein [Candidatus Jorgensenbacteria bacterium]